MEAVERIPYQVLLSPVSADCRVCLGLAGGPLLDIALPHRQCHAAVCSGVVLFLEDLVKKRAEVSALLWEMVGAVGSDKEIPMKMVPFKIFSDLAWEEGFP